MTNDDVRRALGGEATAQQVAAVVAQVRRYRCGVRIARAGRAVELDPGDVGVTFFYVTPEDKDTEGVEVTVFAPSGAVVDSMDFG